MPCGFPAYAEKSAKFPGLSRKELMRASLDALDDLRWRPRKDGPDFIRASVPAGFYLIFLTFGAKFTVEIEDERLFIRSEATTPIAWVDFGQHGDSIKKFLDQLDDVLDDRR